MACKRFKARFATTKLQQQLASTPLRDKQSYEDVLNKNNLFHLPLFRVFTKPITSSFLNTFTRSWQKQRGENILCVIENMFMMRFSRMRFLSKCI